jgi:hypothetical protein
MVQGLDSFLRDYVEALERGSAALFVGAGLSMAADMPSWSKLLDGVARDIGLDVGREHDLVSVAQFYVNRRSSGRTDLAQLVRRSFSRSVEVPDNHRILARLPLEHVWTTNYDELIERAWEQAGKVVDVKHRNKDLTTSNIEANAVLYKMHGTASHPDDIVLTKDDYELYPRQRPGFLQILGSDLATRTFLFLGLSFTDPNLNYLMAALRSSFADMPRRHYTVMTRPKDEYKKARFEHFITDLERYGIRTLVVDDYGGITEILKQAERQHAHKNVFVSGSYPDDAGDPVERARLIGVARGVGRVVGRRGLRLITGFGRVVGGATLAGMVEALEMLPGAAISRRIQVHPVREVSPPGLTVAEYKRRGREDMIAQAGIIVVVGGLRQGEIAPGVLQEFEIARTLGKTVLPLAATGHAAARIHEIMRAEPEKYLPKELDRSMFDELGPATTDEAAMLAALDRCIARIVA